MFTLGTESLDCLRRAGWTEYRRIDTQGLKQANADIGLIVSERAVDFFAAFGNLKLEFPHFRIPRQIDWCHFDSVQACGSTAPEVILEYQAYVKSQLTVVGEARSDHMVLCMDELGRVFGGFEDILVKFGNSGICAINCLCEGREAEPVLTASKAVLEVPPGETLTAIASYKLTEAGWFEGRSVLSTRTCVPNYADTSRLLSRKVADFLDEFDGLTLCCDREDGVSELCEISSQIDASLLPPGHLSDYQSNIGQKIIVIGELKKSDVILLMSEDGRVFAGINETPDIIWFVGSSGRNAINNIASGHQFARFPGSGREKGS